MRKMLDEKLGRFEELERLMLDPAVQSESSRMSAIVRERGSLVKLVTAYRAFKRVSDELAEIRAMANSQDAEERELANEELPRLKKAQDELWDHLLEHTIGGEDANRSRCVMEIRAGTGGG